jgi:hypothetical protein
MNPDYIADLLGTLPSYTEATFTNYRGESYRGIARDLPKAGRRWTVNGNEWFITAETLRVLEIVKVEIELGALEVIQ